MRWSELLADYNFVIKFRPGKCNGAADALSRKDKPLEGGDSRSSKTNFRLLDPQLFLQNITSTPLVPEENGILNEILDGLPNDPYFGLFHKGAICVPDHVETKRKILSECHDSPAAGHFGISKTFDLVSREYYWPGLRKYVKNYVLGCDTCTRNKTSHHKPYGLLQPLPVPDAPWTSISVDFITQLPNSGPYSAICVFVDRFTKMALFIPTSNSIDAEGTATLFIKHVFCHYGTPSDIVSDRGSTFTSKFTQSLLKGLQVKQKLSTAFHPQTDGQTERVNSILEQYLRCFVNYQQDDWSDYLPIAQFAYNNSKHSTTDTSPFFALYGYHPRLSVTLPRTTKDHSPAEERLQKLHDLHADLKFNIALAQEGHARFFDRRVISGPQYEVGDKVWLASKNIKSRRPTGKLDYKRRAMYEIGI